MEFDTLSRIVQMLLGVGLVIFVHELGHFIAARLCRVRVDTFSLGFGPKLFGWQRGQTLYQIALLPIGGYCRMAGEDPSEQNARPRSDELRAKSVGQRFFIYSGGVIMNVIFAAVALPLVLFHGVPFSEPLIGGAQPGSPAWHARLLAGTRVLEVNGAKVASFDYIAQEIALGPPQSAELVVLEPGADRPRTVRVKPEYDEQRGLSTIGIFPSIDLGGALRVEPDSPAARAGLSDEDRLVGVEGGIPGLMLDEQLALLTREGGALPLRVRGRDGRERTVTIEPELEQRPESRMLGVSPVLDVVEDLRTNEDLATLGLRRGDRILRVNGQRLLRDLDLELGLLASTDPVRFQIERDGQQLELTGPSLDHERALRLARDIALGRSTSLCQVVVMHRAPVAGLLQDGDRLLAANGIELHDWETDFLPIVRPAAAEQRPLQLRIARTHDDGTTEELEVTASAGPQTVVLYGFSPREAQYVYRAGSLGEAVRVGAQGTWKFATDAWLTIKRMVLGQVSSKHMGGPISIGMASFTLAEQGLAKLLYFLCLLSVNLAIINVLPIPLLDGGHLLFLAIEKLKGSPVSERVFGYSQVVGLVLILTLLIYVTYNDVMRFVGP